MEDSAALHRIRTPQYYLWDARKIIKDIRAMEKNYSPFSQVLEDIKFLFRSISDWQLCFRPREGNIDVHRLAKYALSCTSELVWLEESLAFIQYCILHDQ